MYGKATKYIEKKMNITVMVVELNCFLLDKILIT